MIDLGVQPSTLHRNSGTPETSRNRWHRKPGKFTQIADVSYNDEFLYYRYS